MVVGLASALRQLCNRAQNSDVDWHRWAWCRCRCCLVCSLLSLFCSWGCLLLAFVVNWQNSCSSSACGFSARSSFGLIVFPASSPAAGGSEARSGTGTGPSTGAGSPTAAAYLIAGKNNSNYFNDGQHICCTLAHLSIGLKQIQHTSMPDKSKTDRK